MTDITDPNCIIRCFESSNIAILKECSADKQTYWFRANDIAKTLGLTNISASVQNFTETEKALKKVETKGGKQNVLFLTSRGLYRLLYASKKNAAQKFRDWVGDILDDIIFNDAKQLRTQIEAYHKKLEELQACYKTDKHHTLVTSYDQRPVVYLADIGGNKIKYGKSDNLKDRVNTHKRFFGQHFTLIHVTECKYNGQLETRLQQYTPVSKRLTTFEGSTAELSREIIQLDENFTQKDLIESLETFKRQIVYDMEQKEKHVVEKVDFLYDKLMDYERNVATNFETVISNISVQTVKTVMNQLGNGAVPQPRTIKYTGDNQVKEQQNVKSLPALPRAIDNMRIFYDTWKTNMKTLYDEHKATYQTFLWRKVFGKQGDVMAKRYHMTKDFLEFLDSHPDQTETLLSLFETFCHENKLAHTGFVKRVFYGALRPNNTYSQETAYKDLIQKFIKLMADNNFQLPTIV